MPEITEKLHHTVDVLLPDVNDEGSWTLPLPGTFIIDTTGKIVWRFAEAFYVKRAEPNDILNALNTLVNNAH